MLENVNKDICQDREIKALCAYAGAETIYKVSQMAYSIRFNGGSDDDVINAITPIFNYGITKNLEKLYGKEGLSNSDFAKIYREKGLDKGVRQERRGPLKLKKGDGNSRILCLGLNTNVDTQTISSTNPIYGRQYRLVSCSAGLNIRRSGQFLFWKWSAQAGFVFTHSRFARKIALWHLTGADKHICSYANALGNDVTKCNDYKWSSPTAIKARFLWNQPAGVVVARGHAHKLGRNFNTNRNY